MNTTPAATFLLKYPICAQLLNKKTHYEKFNSTENDNFRA